MALKNLLKPLKFVDEQVLRQYSKLIKKWEDKGRSRYSLARIFNSSAVGGTLLSIGGDLPIFLYSISGGLQGADCARNTIEPSIRKDISEDGIIAKLPEPLYSFKKISNGIRLPLLGTGLAFMGKGGLELIDYFKTNNSTSLSNAIGDLSFGYGFVGLASSMYVKESDPKLLDKEPFWKTAYEKVSDKVRNLVPEPNPLPLSAPIGNCNTLENYVE